MFRLQALLVFSEFQGVKYFCIIFMTCKKVTCSKRVNTAIFVLCYYSYKLIALY